MLDLLIFVTANEIFISRSSGLSLSFYVTRKTHCTF